MSAARWWTYQRERFPVFGHGPLVLVFSASAVCYSALLRARGGTYEWPEPLAFVVAFAVCFLFFLQLRIADEFKDADEDARFRPYRPVPRGLVTLRELFVVGLVGGVAQFAVAGLYDLRLVPILLVAWIYFALMSREFFVREWIRRRHFTYLWTHMMVMPIVDLFATACDWVPHQPAERWFAPPSGLAWFLVASYFNGVVIEVGRKIRAPESEETGVDSYTAVWGRPRALLAWTGAATLTAAFAIAASHQVGWSGAFAPIGLALLAGIGVVAVRFLRAPSPPRAKAIELASGLWTLGLYAGLGVAPAIARSFGGAGA